MALTRRRVLWAVAALLGIAVTAALTWSISQLTGQRIGLSSEPLSMIHGLAPPHPSGRQTTTRPALRSVPGPGATSSTPGRAVSSAPAAAASAASVAPVTVPGAPAAVPPMPGPVAPSVRPAVQAGGQSPSSGGSPTLSGGDHQDDSGAPSGRPRPQRDD
jgi:hypothetical protein